jgi:hypothetical protein
MATRKNGGRLLFAILLAIGLAMLLVVFLTWGVGVGGSGAG